jgi:taurine dioxygenase
MYGTTLSVHPLTPAIGAEILGVDLRKALEPVELQAIRAALTTHQVIFFRDQDLSVAQQVAFGRLFGELVVHPNDPGLAGHPEVMIIHADASSKRVAGERWHSDVSCDAEPPMGSILRLHTVPPGAATRCSPACTPLMTPSRRRCRRGCPRFAPNTMARRTTDR